MAPESLDGKRITDIDRVFTVLRGNFREAIASDASPEQAARFLFDMHAVATRRGSGMFQDSRIPVSPVGDAFFKHTVAQMGFYRAIFSIMRELGYSREDAWQAVNVRLMGGSSFAIPMSVRAKFKANGIALEALEEVYR